MSEFIREEPRLHRCPEVMNPPQSAALGCEAGNLIADHVIGMGHVDRAAKARPADAVPPPFTDELQLEAAIAAAYAALIAAPSWEEKLERWREWVRLLDMRSVSYARFLGRLEQMQSPPSSPTRIAQASVGCSGNAAGGVL